MISLTSVTKLYGTVIGVNDISLSLQPGAYGLIGPNGSGKTTLLNLITGQLRPTLGTVRVFGENPWGSADVLRQTGLCPAVDSLYANVSGLEWVRYLLELHGFDRSEAEARAEQALELVGMTGARHRAMGTYSRGMRQRTKVAQAIAHDPQLLILDEPFNGLDPIGRHDLMQFLVQWIGEGRSLILASHVLHEVEAVTRSFLLICGGRLLASGSADEVHQLLADIPNEIRIRSNAGRELARRLVGQESVEAVRFDGETLVLSTRRPATVYSELPGWLDGTGIRIRELRSSDESLQSLFDSLMRIHRGEAS